jgi:transcriptional regulator with XRE-family HTH domain
MNFGERLRYLREKHGLSREKVANELTLTYGTYCNYETGKREPDFETVKRIALFYNVSADYLLGIFDLPLRPESINDLPDSAKIAIEEFIEFIKNKYKQK